MTLDPAVAATRLGVRRALAGRVEPGRPVVVACSGGADSLALLAATVFEARRPGWRVVGATVDHGLQDGSAEHTDRVVAQMAALGATETLGARVRVDGPGLGPEAAARRARYAVLEQVSEHFGGTTVLLGHTRDDQAETVLLGLARGSGGRSIAGMRRGFDCFLRPLLDVTRAQTVAACRDQGIEFWDDPHNDDPAFTRVRVRRRVLPVLEEELGPGIAAALARTADQLRDDMALLDDLAEESYARLAGADGSLPLAGLLAEPTALRRRVLRLWSLAAGSPAAELFHVHAVALDRLVDGAAAGMGPGGVAGEVQLPGRLTAYRDRDHLRLRPTAVES